MAAAVPLLVQVGIAAGTYVASSWLAPKPKLNPVDKGRFDDIRFQTAEEGAFIPLCFGKRVRLAGNMIWGTVTKEYVTTTPGRTGGKGGGGGGGSQPTAPTTTYTYKKSFAMLVCATPVRSYRRISENLEAIYNNVGSELREDFYEAENHTPGGGATLVIDSECSGGGAVRLGGAGQYVEFNVWALSAGFHSAVIFYKSVGGAGVLLSANGGSETAVSLPATGSTPAAASLTVQLARGANTIKIRRNTGTSYIDRIYVSGTGAADPAFLDPVDPSDPIIRHREITNLIDLNASFPADANNPTPYYNTVSGFDANGYFEGHTGAGGQARFELFAGKETQPQSAIIVAVEGASETPAWRDASYFVTQDYLVKDGQLGNFIFEIEPEIQKLDEILLYLYTLDGKAAASDCDFSALAGITPTGLILDHRAPLEEWVSALEGWYAFDIVPRAGKITAVPRGGAVAARIYERELRARLAGEERQRAAVKITHEDPLDLPGSVDVIYLDPSPSKDFHSGNQTSQKKVGFAFDYETLAFPIVGDPDTAQAVGRRYIDARHLAAKAGELSCGFGRRYLIPTDIVEVELDDGTLYTYRITHKQADLQGLVKFRVVPERPSIYGQKGAGVSGRGGDVLIIREVANTLLVIMDSVTVRQEDVGSLVLYSAGCPRGAGLWPGYHLTKKDTNAEYEEVGGFSDKATIGVVAFASNSTLQTGYDATRSFVVSLYSGSLESRTAAEVRSARVNLALYGRGSRWEVLQFLTVTPITPVAPFVAQYLVAGVFTGLYGTEQNSFTHQNNDYFVLVDDAVKSFPMPVLDATQEITFIGQTAGQALADAEAVGSVTITFQGNSRKPLRPARVELDAGTGRAPRDSAGSVLVTIWPRTNAELVGDEYLLELLTDDRSKVVHHMPLREGVATAALLESNGGTKYTYVIGNTVEQLAFPAGSAVHNTVAARSLQRVVLSGNYVEGTLELGTVGSVLTFGLVREGKDWRNIVVPGGVGYTYGLDYAIRMVYISPSLFQLSASVEGQTQASVFVTTQRVRVRIVLSGTEVRFYILDTPGSPPFYVSPVAPTFPLRAYARIEPNGNAENAIRSIMVSTDPLPTTIVSAAQQMRYYGALKNPMQVRISQYSGVRELGYGPPWEGAI